MDPSYPAVADESDAQSLFPDALRLPFNRIRPRTPAFAVDDGNAAPRRVEAGDVQHNFGEVRAFGFDDR